MTHPELLNFVGGAWRRSNASERAAVIALANDRAFGNQACLFTSSGAAARAFRNQVRAGNVGINLGVAAPMAYYPFSGWGESFFGDLHAQGRRRVLYRDQGGGRTVAQRLDPQVLTRPATGRDVERVVVTAARPSSVR